MCKNISSGKITGLVIIFCIAIFIFLSCSNTRTSYQYNALRGCEASTCHLATQLGEYPPTSGTHGIHLASLTKINCNDCHCNYDLNPLHKNGIINGYNKNTGGQAYGDVVFFNTAKNINGAWNDRDSTCNALACHLSAGWYSSPSSDCSFCHSAGALYDPSANGAHTKHVTTQGYACEKCHNGYKTDAKHINGTLDTSASSPSMIAFDAMNPAGSYSSGSCVNLYCHGAQTTTPDWYNAAALACADCHVSGSAYDPVQKDITSHGHHSKHTVINHTGDPIQCETCHYSYRNNGLHINGQWDTNLPASNIIIFNDTVFYPDFPALSVNASWNNTSSTCSYVSCHGYGNIYRPPNIYHDPSSYYFNYDIIPLTWYSTAAADCYTCHKGDSEGKNLCGDGGCH